MIEVCLVIHKRGYRLPEILKQLQNQTFQNFRLNIWNNSGKLWLDLRILPIKKRRIVNTMVKNIGSQARFKIIKETSGNPIVFIDDDMVFEKDFLEHCHKKYLEYDKKCIIGWFSKTWPKENYHNCILFHPEGTEVDYIGTGGMILDREIFDKESSLQKIPNKYAKVEDLYLCAIAQMKYGMKLIAIEPHCKLKIDGYDQYKKLLEYKERAFISLRKEGWKLLSDNV